MHIIARLLTRWLRRRRPTHPPVYDWLPDLTSNQLAEVRRQDELRRNGRPR